MSNALLAKSKPQRTLERHTLDVLAMAGQYAERWQHLRALAGNETLFDDLILAVLLHDTGKAANGFQAILKGEPDETWGRYRHEILSGALAATLPASDRQRDVLLAIMTHHLGINDEMAARRSLKNYDPKHNRLTPFSDRLAQLEPHWHDLIALLARFKQHAPATIPWPDNLPDSPLELPNPFEHLPSSHEPPRRRRSHNLEEKRLPLRAIYLRGLLVSADHLASAAVSEANADKDSITPTLPAIRPVTADAFPFALNPHQRSCAKTRGSIFLNAPTGSGKTEAALLWAQANQSPQQSRHLFYVLPFTASINAMYKRLRRRKLFGEDAVSLLHGRSSYFAYRWLTEGYNAADDDAQPQTLDPKVAAKQAAAARQLTKELYHPVKVLTPHQILMAFLGTKGWEKSLCEYSGGLFILDEVHAYEPKLTGLLFEMLRRLTRDLGARVCIMSATFPTALKRALTEHIGEVTSIDLTPDERNRYSRHQVQLPEGSVQDHLAEIRSRLAGGERVLVVLNTVAGAIACFDALQDNSTNPCLVHGRLINRERQEAEDRLANKTYLVDLLVGTQAIEVSLDIDFDVLYTDPAPLDALLQRFGRVNRKPLHRLETLSPDARYHDVIVCRQQWPATPAIYDRDDAGKRLLARTLAHLPQGILHEQEVGNLIDSVYDDAQIRDFLAVAAEKSAQLRNLIDTLEPGNEKPYGDDELLDELIDSIPVVPIGFYDEHQACLREGRYFDAQDYLFNITKGRYHALKNSGQIDARPDPNSRQKTLYGLFEYLERLGPAFETPKHEGSLIL